MALGTWQREHNIQSDKVRDTYHVNHQYSDVTLDFKRVTLLFSSSSTTFGDNSPEKSHRKLVNCAVGIGHLGKATIIVLKGNNCYNQEVIFSTVMMNRHLFV